MAKQLLQCRWLIIDEISMVSARLLADIDCKLRSLSRATSPFIKNKHGKHHPFGGLNIVFSGDFWQLPPPDGGFLGDIPTEYIRNARKYTPSPSIAHGQSLLWSDDVETGVQGVTELVECERTKDLWLRSVQDEFRRGELTVETHAFLHGKPTMQPGSFFEGEVKCEKQKCIKRCTQAQARRNFCLEFATATVKMECLACKLERGRRQLVANVATDPRFTNAVFKNAPSVFANNDIKYEVNKLRAQSYSQQQNKGIVYCPAKDTPSTEAMRLRQDLPAKKVSWLNRHDRESGDLYGMLPLMIGMPVAVTEHINRSYDKRLLKGRVGYIHSWVLAPDEKSEYEDGVRILQKLPKVVFVKFLSKEGKELPWTLPGLTVKGLYPIRPSTGTWFLDKGRTYRVLKIGRRQLPLTPAWAMTSHAAQGQTFCQGAIVDLKIGGSSSTMSSYVAITRVEHRKYLLMFRPFPQELFNQGQKQV